MSQKLKLENVSSRYGAPMGRPNVLPANINERVKLHLEKMDMVDGDYDKGGAYWGGGSVEKMYVAWRGITTDFAVRVYVRGITRDDAKSNVLSELPNAVFYR